MNNYITRKSIASTIVFITTTFVSIWLWVTVRQAVRSDATTQLDLKTSEPVTQREEPQQLIDIFSDEDISYNRYEIRRFTKEITDESYRKVEVSYAVLIKKNRGTAQVRRCLFWRR